MTQKCFVIKKKKEYLCDRCHKFFPLLLPTFGGRWLVDTVKDCLFELDMKPPLHLLEIRIFSLNNVTVRLTETMNNLLEHLKLLIFKVIFQYWKLVDIFHFFIEEFNLVGLVVTLFSEQMLVSTMHSVPESLYSFRFQFSWISVFYNRKFKKNREIAEFIPNQLHFHKKNLS